MSSANFTIFHALFSQIGNKPKWVSMKYSLNHKASCFECSPDGSSVSAGYVNGQLVTLRIVDGTLMVSDECTRHRSKITDIAFNPTADLIATCSNENKIILSSFQADMSKTGDRRICMSMSDAVRALAFMEDLVNRSNILFSGVGRRINITDCSTGTTFRILKGHNGKFCLWGNAVVSCLEPKDGVRICFFGVIKSFCSWGGCMFASSSTDKTIRIWDMRVSEAIKVFNPLPAPGGTNAFHVDGSGRILVRSDGSGAVHAFDTSSAKEVINSRLSTKPILCLRIANSCRFMVVADKDRISMCDLRDVLQIPEPSFVSECLNKCIVLRWHPTKPSFVTLDSESVLNLWQLEMKKETSTDD